MHAVNSPPPTQKLFTRIYPGELELPWQKKGIESHNEQGDEFGDIEKEKAAEAEEQRIQDQRPIWGKDGKVWPVLTAGAGLFSDGYVNNSMGAVNTCLSNIYGDLYAKSTYTRTVSSIVFAGTVVGMILFGFIADYHSRKQGMIISTLVLIVFTICCAAAWWGTSAQGLLTLLIVFRFFVGIGIGGEYPAGSVACSEASAVMSKGSRNRWFILFTGFMIDLGYVIATIVPLILLAIFGDNNLTPVWRITIGLGAIPPLSLFYLRTKFEEPATFRKNNVKRMGFPFAVAAKYYGFRLAVISVIWFLYNFVAFPFGIFASAILTRVVEDGNLYASFSWNILLTSFYLPGAFLGAIFADWFGPRLTLAGALCLQGIVGFIMVATFDSMVKNIGAFVVAYGVFMSLGELGPGGNIGLLASKNSPTAIRGVFYCIAASIGKCGAFTGTQIFPLIMGDDAESVRSPFWVSSAMCIVSAILAYFLLPPVTQSSVQDEDRRFKKYLAAHGYDISKIGDAEGGTYATDIIAVTSDDTNPSKQL